MTTPIIGSHRASQAASATTQNAVLQETKEKKVEFKFNPGKITLSHAAKLQEIAPKKKDKPGAEGSQAQPAQGPGQFQLDHEAALKEVGGTSLTMSELIFYGQNVARDCNQLLDWTKADARDINNPKLPTLTFIWGTTLNYTVNLISVDITYERFTAGGKPIRAKATLKLNIVTPPSSTPTPPVTSTNPTSGGIPGRRGHTMVAGENLQHVAMANYGRPGAWRALAAANGIEDPLAVPPGTVIYVPAPSELAELAGGSQG
jgi:hypothetical protein